MSAPPDNTLADPEQLIDLQRQLAECKAERDEALRRETATAEVLQVINSSPGDLAPVFDAILDKALRLCEATHGHIWRVEGQQAHAVALRGDARFIASMPRESRTDLPGRPLTRIARGERIVRLPEIAKEEIYRTNQAYREFIDATGIRSAVMVALRKDEALLGAIAVHRKEVLPFTKKQLALLQSFAAQAVIAMENARLLTQLRQRTRDLQESLEYQTATSDVLKVISRSTFDLQPVLDALVATAARLTNADQALIASREGDIYRAISILAVSSEQEAFLRGYTFVPGRGSVVGRVALSRQIVQIPDLAADPEYAMLENVRLGGTRTVLGVPLLREGEPIGVLNVARQRVEPFTEKQIQLVSTFADQAVIAIENARLLNDLQQRTRDLQESLEYQTATSDVLKVISRSGAELGSVLNTLVETAARICEADNASIWQLQDGSYKPIGMFGYEPQLKDALRRSRLALSRATLIGRTVLERKVVQIDDAAVDPEYGAREHQELGGYHTMLGVPLVRESELIGVIGLARLRIEPFTESRSHWSRPLPTRR